MATLKLGELLLQEGIIGKGELQRALAEQQRTGGRLGELLVQLGLVSEVVLVRTLAAQLSLPAVDLDAIESIPATLKERLPLELVRAHGVVPLRFEDEGRTLVIATADPRNAEALHSLEVKTRSRLLPSLVGRSALLRAVRRFYGAEAAPPAPEATQAGKGGRARKAKGGPRPTDERTALYALVELLIERGVISREEFLARVKG